MEKWRACELSINCNIQTQFKHFDVSLGLEKSNIVNVPLKAGANNFEIVPKRRGHFL